MITKLKENNFLKKVNEDLSNKEKVEQQRPNIDHLIKRLLVERRREKRNTLALGFVILSAVVSIIFFNS